MEVMCVVNQLRLVIVTLMSSIMHLIQHLDNVRPSTMVDVEALTIALTAVMSVRHSVWVDSQMREVNCDLWLKIVLALLRDTQSTLFTGKNTSSR